MSQNANTDCLYTTVKNVSGKERVFGFLGERGKRLLANETFTQRGDLVAKLGAQTSARRFKALERSLLAGSLEIVKTPAVHLYDDTDDVVRMLVLDNGVLGFADPCWASSGSSDFTDGSP